MHAPALQVIPDGQMLSQAPQLDALVARFTQPVPHWVRLVGHGSTHLEPMQSWPPEHALPQPPQLAMLLVTFTQVPDPAAVGHTMNDGAGLGPPPQLAVHTPLAQS